MTILVFDLQNRELCSGCRFLCIDDSDEKYTAYSCLKRYFLYRNYLGRRVEKCIEDNG